MPLVNACFLSYRHGQYELMREFITDFAAALRAELEPMLGSHAVYVDQERLRGGDFYHQALARSLYESATLVMIYTPTYFHAQQTYCAREYLAMESLERRRLAQLGLTDCRSHGLILPVVLRGAKHLPAEIRERRQFYDFEGFQLGGRRLSRHARFAPAIRDMAGYICERYHEQSALPDHVFADCEGFCLPGDEEVRPVLDVYARFRMPFPGRGDAQWAPAAV